MYLCACVCVCVYVCVYTYIYTYIYKYIYIYMCVYIHLYSDIYIYVYVIYIYIYKCSHMYTFMYIYIYMYTSIHTCIYTYIYIYIYTYIYTHICTHTYIYAGRGTPRHGSSNTPFRQVPHWHGHLRQHFSHRKTRALDTAGRLHHSCHECNALDPGVCMYYFLQVQSLVLQYGVREWQQWVGSLHAFVMSIVSLQRARLVI